MFASSCIHTYPWAEVVCISYRGTVLGISSLLQAYIAYVCQCNMYVKTSNLCKYSVSSDHAQGNSCLAQAHHLPHIIWAASVSLSDDSENPESHAKTESLTRPVESFDLGPERRSQARGKTTQYLVYDPGTPKAAF